jgi:hypothetical protein
LSRKRRIRKLENQRSLLAELSLCQTCMRKQGVEIERLLKRLPLG